jgi:hypothetical protein
VVSSKSEEAAVDEPAGTADVRGDFLEKRDDVVVGALLVLADLLDVERGLGADDLRVLGGNVANQRHAVAGEHFNFEPMVELGFFAPKRGHLGPGITGNHAPTKEQSSQACRGISSVGGVLSRKGAFQAARCQSIRRRGY